MRTLLLLSLLLTGVAVFAQAPGPAPKPATPTPAKPAPAPSTPTPQQAAPPKPAPRRATPAARSGISMLVTDMKGATLSGIHVELNGPTTRMAETDEGGRVNFPGLQAGTYRLRFSGDDVTAFEKEVALKSGNVEHFDVALTPAAPKPEPPAPVAPPPPAPAAVGPAGQPQIGSVTSIANRERDTKTPRRELPLSCSGNTRTEILVLNEEQPQRIYQSAETTFYVLSGQGTAHVGSVQSAIDPGDFVAVPRSTPFSLSHRGNRPLVMLWTLSGEACEQPK